MKQYTIFKKIIVAGIIILSTVMTSTAQDNSAALAAADSSHFSVNYVDGWQLFNSYVAAYAADSVQLEIIIQHNNTIDWTQEQYVGKVKTASFVPHVAQSLSFNLITAYYILRIDTQGKCYLRLSSGAAPAVNPAIIPVNVIYKK